MSSGLGGGGGGSYLIVSGPYLVEQRAVCKRYAQPLKTETYKHHVVWTRGGGGSYLIVSGPYLVEQRAVCKRNAQPLKTETYEHHVVWTRGGGELPYSFWTLPGGTGGCV